MRFRDHGRLSDQLIGRSAVSAVGDILAHRSVKQEYILADQADRAADIRLFQIPQVDSIQRYAAAADIVIAQQQLDYRALASASRPDNRHRVASRHIKRQVSDYLAPIAVGEVDMIQTHIPADLAQRKM